VAKFRIVATNVFGKYFLKISVNKNSKTFANIFETQNIGGKNP
jgi:hypothetical protein